MIDEKKRRTALGMTPVGEVWGVGRRTAPKLKERGIETALQLSELDELSIRKRMGIVGLRLVKELNGIACSSLQRARNTRKSITCSGSFGRPVTTMDEMKQAVAAYCSRAASELRRDGLVARRMTVYMLTNRFRQEQPQHNPKVTIDLAIPTDNTGELIHAANDVVEGSFKPGCRYKKAGVILTELVPAQQNQADIFDSLDRPRNKKLMSAVDALNERFGSKALQFAAQCCRQPWHMKCELRTPAYTTDWEGLLQVRVG